MPTKAELEDENDALTQQLAERDGVSESPAHDARPERSLPDLIAEWNNTVHGTSYTGDNILVRGVRSSLVYYIFRNLPDDERRVEQYAIYLTPDGKLVDPA